MLSSLFIMERRHRRLPPLTKIEEDAVRLVKEGGTACSGHLFDQGLIPNEQRKPVHEALRRVAKRAGVYEPNAWIGRMGTIIFNEAWLNKR